MVAKRTDFSEKVFQELSWEWQKMGDIIERLAALVPPGQALRQYESRTSTSTGARPISEDFMIYSGQKDLVRRAIWSQKNWVEFRGEGDAREVRFSARGTMAMAGRCLYCGGPADEEGFTTTSGGEVLYTDHSHGRGSVDEEEEEVTMLRNKVTSLNSDVQILLKQIAELEERVVAAEKHSEDLTAHVAERFADQSHRITRLTDELTGTAARVTESEAAMSLLLARLVSAVDSVRAGITPSVSVPSQAQGKWQSGGTKRRRK